MEYIKEYDDLENNEHVSEYSVDGKNISRVERVPINPRMVPKKPTIEERLSSLEYGLNAILDI